MTHKFIAALLLLGLYAQSYSQVTELYILSTDSVRVEEPRVSVTGRNDAISKLDELIKQYRSSDYLEASIDSMYTDSSSMRIVAKLHRGPKYRFDDIKLDSLDNRFVGYAPKEGFSNTESYLGFRRYVLASYADNGYPFARMRLSSNDSISNYLKVNSGPLIIVDSLIVHGNLRLSSNYLNKYLGVQEGSVYRHSRIRNISDKLSQLSFLEQHQQADLTFYGNYSTINLYLNEKNTSRFDFIFGIIPTNSLDDRNLFLSVDLTAELLNRLGGGEYIFVDFERLRPEQQKFEFQFNYPYFLKSSYGLDVEFSIFRLSLDYQTLVSDIGLEYIFDSRDKLKLSWSYESSNIVELDTLAVLQRGRLPEDLDVSQNGIAIKYSRMRLDYRQNPRSGYSLQLRGAGGLRTIKRNSSLLQLKNDQLDFSEAYDSLDLSSARFDLSLRTSKFFPTGKRTTIATILNFGWRYSEQDLYRNEKFQIGGNKLLRGFDEARFFTSYYGVASLEYRLLLSNNSYMSIPFVDAAVLEDESGQSSWAVGVGAGLGIETGAGLFQFSIATGRTETGSFDLRRPKVHLGFASLF